MHIAGSLSALLCDYCGSSCPLVGHYLLSRVKQQQPQKTDFAVKGGNLLVADSGESPELPQAAKVTTLPVEILPWVLQMLDPKSVVECLQVCHAWEKEIHFQQSVAVVVGGPRVTVSRQKIASLPSLSNLLTSPEQQQQVQRQGRSRTPQPQARRSYFDDGVYDFDRGEFLKSQAVHPLLRPLLA